jgi:hypothetical protein
MNPLTAISVAVLMMQTAPVTQLAPADEAAVRQAVYGKHPSTAVPRGGLGEILLVPDELVDVYRRHPAETLKLLIMIAEGAAPADSILAVGYAMELAGGPGRGAVITLPSANRVAAYDVIDKDWKRTPRQHWVDVVRKLVAK